METNKGYTKPQAQVNLEGCLQIIKDKGLTISQLKGDPKNASLDKEFTDALTDMIFVLVHEQHTHKLIVSIAKACNSKYDEKRREYDLLYDTISLTYLGLYSVIKKSANINRVRIDTLFDTPEFFVQNLRAYIQNNILMDLLRKYAEEIGHIEPDITDVFGKENALISKLDSMNFNRNNLEKEIPMDESVCNKIMLQNDMRSLVNAVINRFYARKPVAGYVFLKIMSANYDPRTVVTELQSQDFNYLFHTVLKEVEATYEIDLSDYNNTVFNAEKYLSSFRTVSDKVARARIDCLASQTRGDVQKLPAYKAAKANYESKSYACAAF